MKKLLFVMAVIVAGLTSCEKNEILIEPVEEKVDSIGLNITIEEWETDTITVYIEF